jgi:hypothetical protein
MKCNYAPPSSNSRYFFVDFGLLEYPARLVTSYLVTCTLPIHLFFASLIEHLPFSVRNNCKFALFVIFLADAISRDLPLSVRLSEFIQYGKG